MDNEKAFVATLRERAATRARELAEAREVVSALEEECAALNVLLRRQGSASSSQPMPALPEGPYAGMKTGEGIALVMQTHGNKAMRTAELIKALESGGWRSAANSSQAKNSVIATALARGVRKGIFVRVSPGKYQLAQERTTGSQK